MKLATFTTEGNEDPRYGFKQKEYIKHLDKIVWIYGGSEGHESVETLKPLKKLNPKIILTQSRIPKAKKVEKFVPKLPFYNFLIFHKDVEKKIREKTSLFENLN